MEDNKGAIDFWFYHALISEDTRDGIYATCNFSNIGPLQTNAQPESVNKSKVSGTVLHCVIAHASPLGSLMPEHLRTLGMSSPSTVDLTALAGCRQMHSLRL